MAVDERERLFKLACEAERVCVTFASGHGRRPTPEEERLCSELRWLTTESTDPRFITRR